MPDLIDLIGDIYDSALEPGRWPRTLEAVSEALHARVLIGRANRGAYCDQLVGARFPMDAAPRFQRLFGISRPVEFIRALPTQPLSRPVTPEQVQGEQAFLESDVYREIFQPLGLRYMATAVLHREPGWQTFMTLHRSEDEGPYSADELERFRILAGHFGRAVAVQFALASARSAGALLKEIVDRFDRGALVVDAGGGIRLANRRARDILQRGDGLWESGGRLKAKDAAETAELLRTIGDCAATSAGMGEAAGGPLRISRQGSARAYVAIVSPLAASMLAGGADRAVALVLVGDPQRSVPPAEHLAALHGFTLAEARLAARLMFDETPAEAADALGVSINTVRFHVRNMLAKTGARRQTALVALLQDAHWS